MKKMMVLKPLIGISGFSYGKFNDSKTIFGGANIEKGVSRPVYRTIFLACDWALLYQSNYVHEKEG